MSLQETKVVQAKDREISESLEKLRQKASALLLPPKTNDCFLTAG